ncbi:cytochrome c3 family protein [Xanthobacteraceae bacterium Astr-EGSB]|uniref:cytochrome c3 family protein n=1 Tax=Astrobacterium formosum TaxID=3069710 RepID=UPI0027B01BDB|nr:cytochrome c3 family protein [Xanthobacteraceae bacterium Astr-EGSB]
MKFSHLMLLAATALFVAMFSTGTVSRAQTMVSAAARTHQALGIKCADCHASAKPTAAAPAAACLKCHGNADGIYPGKGRKQYVGDGGAVKSVNPHQSHLVELPCNECHKTHRASVNYCDNCHLFGDMRVK